MSQIMQGDALMQYRKHPKRVSGKKKKRLEKMTTILYVRQGKEAQLVSFQYRPTLFHSVKCVVIEIKLSIQALPA